MYCEKEKEMRCSKNIRKATEKVRKERKKEERKFRRIRKRKKHEEEEEENNSRKEAKGIRRDQGKRSMIKMRMNWMRTMRKKNSKRRRR